MLAGGRDGWRVRRVEPATGNDASCNGREGGKQAVKLSGFVPSDADRPATQQVVTDAHQVGAELCESRRRGGKQPLCRAQKRAEHVVSTLMRHSGVQPGEGTAYSICRGTPQRRPRTAPVCGSGSSSSHANEQQKPRSTQRAKKGRRFGACAAEAANTKEASLALEQTGLQAACNSEASTAPASSKLGCSLTARKEKLGHSWRYSDGMRHKALLVVRTKLLVLSRGQKVVCMCKQQRPHSTGSYSAVQHVHVRERTTERSTEQRERSGALQRSFRDV